MANALSTIRKRIKAIRKRHPKKSFKSAQAQAGREYRQGKLKKHNKRRKAIHNRRKPRARRKVAGVGVAREYVARTRARVGSHKRKHRRRRASHKKTAPRRRRVGANNGAAMQTLLPVALIGGLGLLAYAVFKGSSTPTPPPTGSSGLVQTGNTYRDSQAQKILAYATAGGLAVDAIIKLIQALNSSDDATVTQISDSIDSGSGIPAGFIAGISHPLPMLPR